MSADAILFNLSISNILPNDKVVLDELRDKLNTLSGQERDAFARNLSLLYFKRPSIGLISVITRTDGFYLHNVIWGLILFVIKWLAFSFFGLGFIWMLIDVAFVSKRIYKFNLSQINKVFDVYSRKIERIKAKQNETNDQTEDEFEAQTPSNEQNSKANNI